MIRFSKSLAGRSLTGRSLAGRSLASSLLALSLLVTGCQTQDIATPSDPAPTQEDVATGTDTSPSQTSPGSDATPGESDGVVPAQTNDTTSGAAIGEEDPSTDMMSIAIYKMDDQCLDYESETVRVERDQAMSQAVGKVMAVAQTYEKFDLTGYRLSYDADSDTATIDLRLSPESERQFVSLTSCEQRSLFGSVQETLMKNSDWSVDAVEFTNRGEELLM